MKLLGCLFLLHHLPAKSNAFKTCGKFATGMENHTCTPEYVIPVSRNPPHGNPCIIIDGDLVVENLDNSSNFEHLWIIRQVTGRILIKNTQLETIIFDKLNYVGYNGTIPGVIIMGNKKLKKFEFGSSECRAEFGPHSKGNKTRYMVVVNNGDYRMPKSEYKELKNWYRSKDQSRFLIDVEQTENIKESELDLSVATMFGACSAMVTIAIMTVVCFCWVVKIKKL